jgi:molybdopterin-guanine dinucleotide biosynthesis protein A
VTSAVGTGEAYPAAVTRLAGIVLAGGRSTRMGEPKALLDWFGTPLLAHVCERLRPALDGPIVVAAASDQTLPALPRDVEVVRDERGDRGPLEGLAAALRTLAGRADAAYVSATDVPLLVPAVVELARSALDGGFDAAVPRLGERMYPLTAAYRLSVLPIAERLLAEERLRALDLVESIAVRWLSEQALRAVDPELDSFRNVNTPADYEDALALARARNRA